MADAQPAGPTHPPVTLSVVAPAHNEADNVVPLVDEVGRAIVIMAERFPDHFPHGFGSAEFILVDDGSTDETRARAAALQSDRPWLRIVATTNTPPGKGNGQSAAFHAGFRAARGAMIAALDADLQNDPADLPAMVERLITGEADMVQGDRSHARQDARVRKLGSRVGRVFRKLLLGDTIRDTGCSLRVMKREVAVRLPLEFRGMHRFIPVTARQLGFLVVEQPVNHRARVAGEPKYGLGITQRALPGLIDCFAVRWMRNRRRPVSCDVIESCASANEDESSHDGRPATSMTRAELVAPVSKAQPDAPGART
jgi:glycosyltransferase involved in cell wall biosynthesis